MSNTEDDLEIISENGAITSDEWVKECGTASLVSSPDEESLKNVKNHKKSATNHHLSPALSSRTERWINLLGIRNKPDPYVDWDNLYNCKNQSNIRKDCRELLKKIQSTDREWTVPELESLLTLYCKRRNVDYDPEGGWLEILGKLLLLPFDQCNMFNIFWAITTNSSKIYDLFRLLLQYHDPQLCSYLDSYKIQPADFTKDWFSTLLAKNMGFELCCEVWDRYFEKGDPFLIFFIALAFVQNAKEEILKMDNRDCIISFLKTIPEKMSLEDIHDLLEICFVHLKLTPNSLREDFHCMLFGSNLLDEYSELPLNRLICLPISAQELFKRTIDVKSAVGASFSYFLIDTRPQKNFNSGSISGSYNLNAETIVENPENFGFAMSTLMEFKRSNYSNDHICFLGSGREEEDRFQWMAISRFLHQNYKHISYVEGGYRALHGILRDTGNLDKLSNHFKRNDCIECKNGIPKNDTRKSTSILERLRRSIQINKIPIANPKKPISATKKNLKHVSSKERHGKRYRNVQSVFSLNEESLSSDVDDFLHMGEIEPSVKVREKLPWADIIKESEIGEHFEGEEVLPSDNEHIPCYIGLSRTHMHIFHKVPGEPAFVYPSFRHPLASILRVTSKRRFPEFLTFKFGYDLPTGESHVSQVHYFIIPKAGECAKAVKLGILALKPPTTPDDDKEKEEA